MKQYKVIKGFNDSKKNDFIWLNERRAKSELRNGNVAEIVEQKDEKIEVKTKEEKSTIKTKAPVKRKKK